MRRSGSILAGVAALLTVPLIGPAAGQAAPAGSDCRPWVATTVARVLGGLENLAFDGRGTMLLSRNNLVLPGSFDRLTPDGRVHTVVENVDTPGGIAVRGRTAYFNTGDALVGALLGTQDGTIATVDLDTGVVGTHARGLKAPNGLAMLPNGDAVVTAGAGLTLISHNDPSRQVPFALPGVATNGLALDPSGRWLYTETSFLDPTTTVYAVDLHDPAASPREWTIPSGVLPNFADDLVADGAGNVFVALNFAGKVVRLDTRTGATCTIADGLIMPTSVRFGAGPGWDDNALYLTALDGAVRKLTPPA